MREGQMRRAGILGLGLILCVGLVANGAAAEEEQLDGAKMLEQFEQKLGEESGKLEELKPEFDAFSESMKRDIEASVDKGFVELEELSKKLDEATKMTEAKVKEMLSSEEYVKLKEFMAGLDREAVEAAKKKLTDELTKALELTEEQVTKLKPILEESVSDLSEIMTDLAKSGSSALEEFKTKYEELSKNLREQLKESLEKDQLEKFDEYQQEKKDKISREVFEV
jgi:hypothetical protein